MDTEFSMIELGAGALGKLFKENAPMLIELERKRVCDEPPERVEGDELRPDIREYVTLRCEFFRKVAELVESFVRSEVITNPNNKIKYEKD